MRAGVKKALSSLYDLSVALDFVKCGCIAYSNKNIHLKMLKGEEIWKSRGLSLGAGFRWE